MSKELEIQRAVALLEKVTGKKVILEFPEQFPQTAIAPSADTDDDVATADPSEIDVVKSTRQLGSEKALATKGYQNWTPEQYAMCYFLKKYGKIRMPMPYKTMTIQQLADEMNAKQSTLGMNGENIKYLLTGDSSLKSAGPKAAALVQKFETMDIDQIWRHARRAIEQGRLAKQVENDPRLVGKNSTMGKKASDYSPEVLAKINARRAERGEAPLPESVVRKAIARLNEKKKLAENELSISDVIQNSGKKIAHAAKLGDTQLVAKLRAQLQDWLEGRNYNIEADPYAVELVFG